ncbi:MAG: hypothetical protein K8U57_09645 [Planctomycetes bacterium]|nr:hypothetical protein [Planctomycetota bacterium]
MSTALKCPNPSCPYLFDPSTVPPGVVLACPRCGMRFTLGAPAAAAPPPAYHESAPTATFSGPAPGGYGAPPGYPGAPPGYPPPPPPHYSATQPSYPSAPPPGYGAQAGRPAAKPTNATFGDMTPDTAKADGEEGPRLPKRASKFQTQILVGVGILAMCCAGIAMWYKITHRHDNGGGSNGEIYKDKDRNFSLEPPPKPWVKDEATRSMLSSPYMYVFKREDPEAFMAFGAKDFAPSSPRPSQLDAALDQALDKLLEKDTRKKFPEEGDKTWMGQETRAYKFSGALKSGGNVEGDARAFAHKGVGYWFLSWTGEGDLYNSQKSAFADGRRRCKLLELRKDWKEKQSPTVPFKNNVVPYTILDAEGMWEEVNDEARVKAEDPKADKYLITTKDRKKKDHQEEAECVVLLLDGSGNPLADARAHVETEANKLAEIRGKTIFSEFTGEMQGDPPNTVDGNAEFALLKSTNERDPGHAWFYAISAIKVGDKTVAVVAKCEFKQRAAFDTKFVQLVKSLRGS